METSKQTIVDLLTDVREYLNCKQDSDAESLVDRIKEQMTILGCFKREEEKIDAADNG